MVLFLPFKLILFQYGTFAVIIILLLHVIPSIMTENAIAWGKGFVLVFVGLVFFSCLILSTAIISEDKPIYPLKSFLSIPSLTSVSGDGDKVLLQSNMKKELQLFH